MNEQKHALTDGPIVPAILAFFFPILLGTFFISNLHKTIRKALQDERYRSAEYGK